VSEPIRVGPPYSGEEEPRPTPLSPPTLEVLRGMANGMAATFEQVNHPAHYGGEDNQFETVKVLEAWLSPEAFRGFLRGNAIKYLSRAGKKPGAGALIDLQKARWYLDREIASVEQGAKS
jgi:hypothetical protein